jgi:hypothetical protein
MAAITPVAVSGPGTPRFVTLRNATAQANIGQTDWLWVPPDAVYAYILFTLTAAAGTTPVTNLTVKGADPVTLDDTYSWHVGGVTLTAQNTTATSGLLQVVEIGPGITQAADDVILGATGVNHAAINAVLPTLLGLGLVFDRTTGDETYTYKLMAQFTKFRR